MAIFDSAARLLATFLSTLQTRIELLTVELEEEALRYFLYLLLALAAMACLGIAVLLAILLIVVIYWDTHRIPVLVGLIVFFALAAVVIMLGVRNNYRKKSRLLAHTLAEMAKDVETLNSPTP
ncbi:MAG: phage holin family protein [Burkholderiaceae bacterium]